MEEPRVYEVRVHGFASVADALAAQDPIARVLCPEESHDGPCDVPWGFTLGEESGGTEVLVLGLYATRARAAEIAESVGAIEQRAVTLHEGNAEAFESLVEQYEIERGNRV